MFDHIQLKVKDLKASKRFYTGLCISSMSLIRHWVRTFSRLAKLFMYPRGG
jgi:catechol 2,3-dioxygenase-like lactoylglutathione lyase family enzyme